MRIPVPDLQRPGAIAGDRLVIQAPDITAPARAIQGLGKAISGAFSGLAEEHKANQDRMAGYQANLGLERWQTDQAMQYQSTVDQSAPDGSDIVSTLEKNLAASYQAVRATIKDPELLMKSDLLYERTRGSTLVNGVQAAKKRGQSYVQVTTGESIAKATETGAIKSETEYQDYYENVVKPRIDSVFTDPLQRQEAHKIFGGQMATEFLRRNPGRATPKVTSVPSTGGDVEARKFLLTHLTSDKSPDHINDMKAPLATGLASLIQSAPPEVRDGLQVFSGTRSITRQKELWREALLKYGSAEKARKWVAPPGGSQHNHGNAADLSWKGRRLDKAPKEVRDWVHANAGKHGLNFRMAHEPWHVEANRGGGLSAQHGGGGTATTQATYEVPAKPTGGMWDSVSDDDWNGSVKAGQTAYKEALDLGMEQGQVSRADITDAPIDVGEKAVLLRRWDDKNKDAIELADFADRYQAGGFINPKDATDRKSAGKLLDIAGGGEAIAKGDPDAVRSMFEVYDKTGIVPDNVKGGIEAMLRSGKNAEVTTALSYLDQFNERNHRAFTQEFTGDSETLLSAYKHGLAYASPRAKAEEVMKAVDPALAETRKARRDDGVKAAAKFDLDDVKDTFDPTVLPFDQPDLTIAPNASDELMSDYRMLYADAFALTGDESQARKVAGSRLAGVWGASAANGGRIMKFPPEVTLRETPEMMIQLNQTLEADLIAKGYSQTADVAFRLGKQTTALPHFLLADKRTVAEWQSGKPVTYQVWVEDQDGMFDVVTEDGLGYDVVRYSFDQKAAREALQPAFDAKQTANRKTQENFDAEIARQKDSGIAGMGSALDPEQSPVMDPFGTGGM